MLLTKNIKIKINNRYIKYYQNLGYQVKGGQECEIKIEDLSKKSHAFVDVKCDICQEEKTIKYYNYTENILNQGFYTCKKCKHHKTKITNLEKYGVECTLQSDDVLEKIKNKNIEKFGTDHYSKTNEFKEKIKETNLEKYGVESNMQSIEFKEKSILFNLKSYGVDHYSKTNEFKEKVKKTNLEKYGVDHYSKTDEFKEKLSKNHFLKLKKENNNLKEINGDEYVIYCDKCDKDYTIHKWLYKNRKKKYKTNTCLYCNPINSSKSGMELKLLEFIKDNYNEKIVYGNRKIIPPKELDIYLPNLKLAFEFNGVYWHNELNKHNKYHLEKTEKCLEKGIQLIHVFEDDWIYKQDIVKSRILNLIGKSKKIFARKCEIKLVNDNKVIRNFLDENHLQGFVGSKIKLGLYYNDELVSLMTFGNLRKPLNQSKKDGSFELLRFCNKLSIYVIGGASKLFNYFLKNYEICEIISYADRSWSNGNLYEKLGFEFIHKTQPNYYYIIGNLRKHRFNFRKDKLIKEGFDSNKTEHEIMLEREIYRIYDSGSLKYSYLI